MKKLALLRRYKRYFSHKIFLVMKMCFMLLFVSLTQLSAIGYSQGKVSLNVENEAIREVFRQIKDQTGMYFVYNEESLDQDLLVTAQFENELLKDALSKILKDSEYDFEISDYYVVIKPGKEESTSAEVAQQQKVTITGTVKDEDDIPIPGVNIIVKELTLGTITDIDGKYRLSEEIENGYTLIFSFVGMKTQEIVFDGLTEINLTMQSELQGMDEVVVTGYQILSKERASGSFEKVDAKRLESKITRNIISRLNGETPGVLFNSDGTINIRGVSTLNPNDVDGYEEPLYVLDGFPIQGGLETINPNDIESITVLKDAAAASIWGARAANGVVVIVSKKSGKKKAPTVEFMTSLSVRNHDDLKEIPYLSTDSFLEFEQHKANNEWQELPSGAQQPALTQGMDTYLKLNAGLISPEEAEREIAKLKGVDVRDEFEKLFMRKEIRQQYNLSIYGGGEKSTYNSSINYDKNHNQIKGHNYERITTSLRYTTELRDWLKFNGGISAIIQNNKTNGVAYSNLKETPNYQTILDENGNYVAQPKSYYQDTKEELVEQGYVDWDYNLYREYENNDHKNKKVDLRLNVGLNIKLMKGLDLDTKFLYEWGDKKERRFYNEDTYYIRDLYNQFTYFDTEENELVSNFPDGSAIRESFTNYASWTTRGQLNFNRTIEEKHQINAFAGIELREYETEFSRLHKYGFDSQSLSYALVNHGEDYTQAITGRKRKIPDSAGFSYNKDRYASYYGNVAYTFDSKYTFTASSRLDDSNLFGATNKYRNVPLWSLGINWQLHQEGFINVDFIDRLAIRASIGTAGNIDRSTSPYLIANITRDWRTDRQYAYVNNPKNPELRWEKTKIFNVGVDYSFWGNSLFGSLEYYDKYSTDLLSNVALNATYGYSSALVNAGEMSNKGIDASIGVRPIKKTISWITVLNFSHNKNVVEKVEFPDETVSGYFSGDPMKDKPLSYMYSYRWAGLSSEGAPQIFNENGDVIDFNTELTEVSALKYEGSLTPRYYGSWKNTFSFKNISLTTLLTYKIGHVFRVKTLNPTDITTSYYKNHVHSDFEKRWQKPGDEDVTDVPRLMDLTSDYTGFFSGYTTRSDNTVESASHIRFTEITASYDLPKRLLEPIGLSRLSIGGQVRNVGVIVFNDKDIDPENQATIDGTDLPRRPEFSLSLKATF